MLHLIENPTLINNQLILGFEAEDERVFCPVKEKPHKVAVVRFGHEIATGVVEPYESLLIKQDSEDFIVTIIPGNNRHFQDVRQSRWRIVSIEEPFHEIDEPYKLNEGVEAVPWKIGIHGDHGA